MKSKEGYHRTNFPGRSSVDLALVMLLLLLTLLFFWKIALTNLIPVGLDLFAYFYPYREYAAQALRGGHLPLWNPYLFLGVPCLANIQAAVLYPLNLLFLWLPAPKMVSYSIVLHIFLAGAFTYLFSRQTLGLGRLGAMVSAVTFAFSGFMGAQVEHVTKLSALAWFPLLLLLFQRAYERRSLANIALAGIAVGLQFLAGHPQASYINLFGVGCYGMYLSLVHKTGNGDRKWVRSVLRALGLLLLVSLLGAGLVAAQLLPTLELASLSPRGGGLPYRQAVSFSLKPSLILSSLLPSLDHSPFSEYIAYLGLLPLLLAGMALFSPSHRRQGAFYLCLALLGLFLSLGLYNPFYYLLYRLVPGFAIFRVPARWLFFWSFGGAILAGLGAEAWREGSVSLKCRRAVIVWGPLLLLLLLLFLLARPPLTLALYWLGWAAVGAFVLWLVSRRQMGHTVLLSLLLVELFVASRYLGYDRATAPEAYSSLRTAVGHLLADRGLYRILSISDLSFDPGDLREIEEIFAEQLPPKAIYDYVVATKWKEVLVPNLSMRYGIATADGYDAGLLPLGRYLEMERLFLPEEEISFQGRLGERLKEMPSGPLLNLLNVKYVIKDKVQDLWIDGVYYDLGHRAILDEGAALVLPEIPWFPTTSLGVISHLLGAGEVEQRTPVAEIVLTDEEGSTQTYYLRAGVDTAEGRHGPGVNHGRAREARRWPGDPEGSDYLSLVKLSQPMVPEKVEIRSLLPQGEVVLQGLSLIDERTGGHRSLVVSESFRLVHSGDVKIYQNLDSLPRAFVVHRARTLDDEAALEAMRTFEPGQEVILSGGSVRPPGESAGDQVSILDYEPERVLIEARLGAPGYLVLTDAYYPGWRALVDGQEAEIERADYYFRAIYLEGGKHIVEFRYEPLSFKIGAAVSLASLAFVLAGVGWGMRRIQGR